MELFAEIVPDVYTRFGATFYFLRDGVSCDLSKDATYFGAEFVFPFPLPLSSSFLPVNKTCVHTYKSSSSRHVVELADGSRYDNLALKREDAYVKITDTNGKVY